MMPPAGQQVPVYQSNQQYTQGGYPPRPQGNMQYPNQGYGPPVSQPPNSNLPPQQYASNRLTANHMSNSQFTNYPQSWPGAPTAMSSNHLPGNKSGGGGGGGGSGGGSGGPPQAPNSPSPGSTRLKQHLQHRTGFNTTTSSMPPSPSPPQNYHMGPPSGSLHHAGMGPPSMGPPNMPSATSPLLSNSHTHEGPMPPPSSTPNSHHQMSSEIMDNGITTTAAGTLATHVTASSGGSVTSVVTTGPDGTNLDEGSQQSTLSNASAGKTGQRRSLLRYSLIYIIRVCLAYNIVIKTLFDKLIICKIAQY